MNNDEINLLQGRSPNSFFSANKISTIRIISFAVLFAVSFSAIVLFILIALSPLPSLQDKKKEELARLSQYHQKMAKILLTKDRLTNIATLLENRNEYASTMESLQTMVGTEVVVDSIKLEGKKITLTLSSNSLLPFDSFLHSLNETNAKEKMFSKIMQSSLLLHPEKGRYFITLELIKA